MSDLTGLARDMHGKSFKGTAFCRACKVDGAAGLDEAAFIALAHRDLCPVRILAERDAARQRADALEAAGNRLADWLYAYVGVIEVSQWRQGEPPVDDRILGDIKQWRALVGPGEGENA